jgi:cytochrome oxidase Cu insertion factor (SCO1/SenC/PrrC family)
VRRFVLFAVIAWAVITLAWWLLALWPVANAPAWLERTRYVCFGIAESGLPDAGGWIGLVAGPIGMLSILLVGWRRAAGRATVAIAAVAIVLIATGATWRVTNATSRVTFADPATPSSYPRLDQPAPAFSLIAQDGRSHSLSEFEDRVVLVTFAYAHCATVCPLVVGQTLRAQRTLRAAGSDAVVLIVTLDPWRDTPARLPGMAEAWQLPATDAFVLSGSVGEVQSTLGAWNVPGSRDARTGEVTHPSVVYVVDAEQRIAFAATGGTETIVALARRAERS